MHENITLNELLELSEKDRWYSLAINPLTNFVVAFAIGSYEMNTFVGLSLGLIVLGFTVFVHYLLNWEFFGSNWKVMFRCEVSGKQYVVLKDGARRLRVLLLLSDTGGVRDIKSGAISYDETYTSWLNHSPAHVQLNP